MNIEKHTDQNSDKLKVSELSPDPEQPRKYFDEDAMDELKESIKAQGILTPLLYREVDGKKNHRFR